jgi:hypothetical protein
MLKDWKKAVIALSSIPAQARVNQFSTSTFMCWVAAPSIGPRVNQEQERPWAGAGKESGQEHHAGAGNPKTTSCSCLLLLPLFFTCLLILRRDRPHRF